MPQADAQLTADTLVQADLWGHQSHGVMRLPWYTARLQSGVAKPVATPEYVVDAGAIGVIDGHDGMGQVLTAHAARDAIRRAKSMASVPSRVRNSNHFGTAMYYTLMAPPEGCIMFLSTNASPALAPWGGRQEAGRQQSLVLGGAGRQACPDGARHREHRRWRAAKSISRGSETRASRRVGPSTPRATPTTDPAGAIEASSRRWPATRAMRSRC